MQPFSSPMCILCLEKIIVLGVSSLLRLMMSLKHLRIPYWNPGKKRRAMCVAMMMSISERVVSNAASIYAISVTSILRRPMEESSGVHFADMKIIVNLIYKIRRASQMRPHVLFFK